MSNTIKEITDAVEDYLKYQEELGVPVYISRDKNKQAVTGFDSSVLDEKLSNISETFIQSSTLNELNKYICDCKKCQLSKTRTKFVFGVGNENADIVFVGEAPGEDEDLKGEPFVGRAGKLLTQTMAEFGWKREDFFICNILKCRPPGNRDPLSEEVKLCEPYLLKQLGIIKPKIILALGKIAGNTLLKKDESLGNLRSKDYTYNNIKLFVTYHPAAILRNPSWKKLMLEDFQKVKYFYENIKSK